VYYGLVDIRAYCNISNSGVININFTSSFPSNIYELEGIYKLENKTYTVKVLDHYDYQEGTNHTGDVFLYNSTHLNYTEPNSTNSTLIPLTWVWRYQNSSSPGAYDGWWTENESIPVYVDETRWKWEYVKLNHITYQEDSIKKYGIENYTLNETLPLMIYFRVPPNTKGKFNLTVTADSSSYSLDPWWNSNWKFRRPITITERSGSTLTDYQVAINLTYDSDMQSDFSDIRFTWLNETSSEEIQIPYWIEEKVDSQWAYVWVKVSEISANGNTTVYVYYGNTTPIESESNATTVFDFWDDASSDRTSEYTKTKPYYMYADDGALAWNSNGYYEGRITRRGHVFWVHSTEVPSDFSFYAKVRDLDTAYNSQVGVAIHGSSENIIGRYIDSDASGDYRVDITQENSSGVRRICLLNIKTDTNWHELELRKFGDAWELFLDGSKACSGNYAPTDSSYQVSLFIAFDDPTLVNWDNVRVRKYASPEPTYTIGSEEKLVYISVTLNYTSIYFGTVSPYSLVPAPDQDKGCYNATIDTNANYQVKAYAYDWDGEEVISASSLYFDTNSSYVNLDLAKAVRLSTTPQIIDTYPSTVTVNYHGYWFEVPLVRAGYYNTTVVIVYENV